MANNEMPFMDLTRMMEQFRLPGVDMNALVEARRKDVEALVKANQQAYQGVQALAQRQAEILQAAASKQVDYSTLADPVEGPIFTTLPEGSFLSLGAVVKLHRTNPELFAWC